jgi:rhodanese-related sulfurtransferase
MKTLMCMFVCSLLLTSCLALSTKDGTCPTYACDIVQDATVVDGVKEISYKQFKKLQECGEPFVLVDALGPASYADGHIPGAINMPSNSITEECAAKAIGGADLVVVYCANVKCHASTRAAKALMALGYTVVDYKGGLQEWIDKGNPLEA